MKSVCHSWLGAVVLVWNSSAALTTTRIGADAYVGSSCVLEGGSAVGEPGELANLSLLQDVTAVPACETWAGSPAMRCGIADRAEPQAASTRMGRAVSAAGFATVAGQLLPLLSLLPMVPALFALGALHDVGKNPSELLVLAPLVGLSCWLRSPRCAGWCWAACARACTGHPRCSSCANGPLTECSSCHWPCCTRSTQAFTYCRFSARWAHGSAAGRRSQLRRRQRTILSRSARRVRC